MNRTSSWKDKVVLVTGGSSGLGKAIASAFATRGAKLVLAARRAEALSAAAEDMRRQGNEVAAITADVTSLADVERLFRETVARFGRLDVLVNNAGRSTRGALLETTPDDFKALFDLNVLGLVACTRAALPHLLASRGHVVNIGSLAGKSAARWVGAYSASKFAVTAYSQQLRLELADQGLHVLLVCPGPIARNEPRLQAAEAEPGVARGHLPDRALRPGAGVRTKAISPERLADDIVRACQTRRPEIIRPRAARLLFALAQISPRLGDWLVLRLT